MDIKLFGVANSAKMGFCEYPPITWLIRKYIHFAAANAFSKATCLVCMFRMMISMQIDSFAVFFFWILFFLEKTRVAMTSWVNKNSEQLPYLFMDPWFQASQKIISVGGKNWPTLLGSEMWCEEVEPRKQYWGQVGTMIRQNRYCTFRRQNPVCPSW